MFPLWSSSRNCKSLIFQETKRLELLQEDNKSLMSRTNKLENTIENVEDLMKEKLKRLKDENERLKSECQRLEGVLLESGKRPCSPPKSEDGVEEFTRVSESVEKSQEEMRQMMAERHSLLEQLEIAKKQRDDVLNEYNIICMKRFGNSSHNSAHVSEDCWK
ncbi:hypothetical protein GE061_018358 [Apolygus lucorum]|uniref:Uncharacterized protein n=1 Tax=Apolygus lucorum TaxID=248454 RepID=A0A8S9XEZ9_APOLU|nr:hypothetical protein GE061_018358 [Apolygus lucorum]